MNRYLILDGIRIKTVPETRYLFDSLEKLLETTSDKVHYVNITHLKRRKMYNIIHMWCKFILFLKNKKIEKRFLGIRNTPQIKKIILQNNPTHIIIKGFFYHYIPKKIFLSLKEKLKFKVILFEVDINNFLNKFRDLYFYRNIELCKYDKVLMISKQMVDYFNKLGDKHVQFLPAFTNKVEIPISKVKKEIDVFFYGELLVRRIIFLEKLKIQNLKIAAGSSGNTNPISSLTSDELKKKIIPKELITTELANVIYRSKIILNISRENWFFIESGVTVRHHQILAHGGFLLTEYCAELDDVYTMGKDLETYKTIEELEDKIQFYLKHDDAREKIAKQGHETFLKRHTTDIRAKEILTILDGI